MKDTWAKTYREGESSESFEVLVQLLFPITLILAFVVITELAALQNTSAGVAEAQRHEAVISLQEQLLGKAVHETFEKEAVDLQLPHYDALLPTPDQVLVATLSPAFVEATQKLYDRFGTATRQSKMRRKMHERSVDHYRELVKEYVAENPGFAKSSIAELSDITPENENKLDSAVAGDMAKLIQTATESQWNLIRSWIGSERATQESGERIAEAWQAFQNAQPADKQNMSDRFLNLKVLALQEKMSGLKAPLLEGAVHDVL